MICAECTSPFIPNHYSFVCDSCGLQLEHSYDALQEFRAGVLDLSVVVSRAVFGESVQVERAWRVG